MRNLSYREPRVRNLGALVSPILRAAREYEESCLAIDEDMKAFHAPSECAELAYDGLHRRILDKIDAAVIVSGMTRRELVAEIKARTGGRWWAWTTYSMGLSSNLEVGP